MKTMAILLLLITSVAVSFAQKDSLDLVIYKSLKDWAKEDKKNVRIFTYTDKKDKSWCQLGVYKSTISKGSIEADFDSEWKELAATPFKITEAPEKSAIEEADGWKIISGSGKFVFNGSAAGVIVTTFSGYNRCVSVVATTANQRYLQDVMNFIGSVELKKPASLTNNSTVISSNDLGPDNTQRKDGFAFSTTNFDDGWTSVIKEDWVETTKGNIKVLLHYPKEGTIFPADPEPLTNAAWNMLVAPRYSSLKDYKTSYIEDYNRPYFGMGNAKENSTGKNVFVLLFRRGAGWLEVVAPNNQIFADEFGFDPATIRWGKLSEYSGGWVLNNSQGAVVKADPEIFNKLDNMFGRNKFAVSANDLYGSGEWSQHFSSNTYWTNVYTGNSAGISTYSSSQWFIFSSGQNYKWQLAAVNSYGGTGTVAQAKGAGSFKSLNNWQLYFSDIEGKPKTYDAYFTVIKGGRVLWLNDAASPGSGIFTGYSKK